MSMMCKISSFIFLLTLLNLSGCSDISERNMIITHVMSLERRALGGNSGNERDYEIQQIYGFEWLNSRIYLVVANKAFHFDKYMISIDDNGDIRNVYNPFEDSFFEASLNRIMDHSKFLLDKNIDELIKLHGAYYSNLGDTSIALIKKEDCPDSLDVYWKSPYLKIQSNEVVFSFDFIVSYYNNKYNIYRDSIIIKHNDVKIYQTNKTNNLIIVM